MTLPGPNAAISLSQVNTELGSPATTQISMNQATVRTLAGVPTGQISMSNLWGKSSTSPITSVVVSKGPHSPPASIYSPGSGSFGVCPPADGNFSQPANPILYTCTYNGGPLGAGPNSDATGLNWSIANTCPGGNVSTPASITSTSAPGTNVNSGSTAPPTFVTQFTVTATAPAPLGSASGSIKQDLRVCLPVDTKISLADGSTIDLGDVKAGQMVKAVNPDTGEVFEKEVTFILRRGIAAELIHVTLEDDAMVKPTPDHECWVRRNGEGLWVPAAEIKLGDQMMVEDLSYKKVIAVERVGYPEGIEVGNFNVADAHVYFGNKILLHNTGI
jgi:hypothetical protein